jgi:hypothetical protein
VHHGLDINWERLKAMVNFNDRLNSDSQTALQMRFFFLGQLR